MFTDVVPASLKGGDRCAREILVGEKAHQAALGNTFSELNVSRAYARHAMMSS